MDDYIELAIRTESSNWHQPNTRLLHAFMGLVTEVAEIGNAESQEDLFEEYGDLFWYLAIACDVLGVTFEDLEGAEIDGTLDPFSAMIVLAAELLDTQKKFIFYGRNYDDMVIISLVGQLYLYVCKELEINDFRLDEVLAANIAKLRKRYGEKFSSQAANNR